MGCGRIVLRAGIACLLAGRSAGLRAVRLPGIVRAALVPMSAMRTALLPMRALRLAATAVLLLALAFVGRTLEATQLLSQSVNLAFIGGLLSFRLFKQFEHLIELIE
jgi:hypothetical protein